jgi:hypothetical protein
MTFISNRTLFYLRFSIPACIILNLELWFQIRARKKTYRQTISTNKSYEETGVNYDNKIHLEKRGS